MLYCLLDQDMLADRILMAYLQLSLRHGQTYPDPAQLRLPAGVDVVRCPDHGPATKLIPTLALERDTLLIVVDDDVVYPSGFIRTRVGAHARHPDKVCAYRGFLADQTVPFGELHHVLATHIAADTRVDIVFGIWGYLLPSWLLPPEATSFADFPA